MPAIPEPIPEREIGSSANTRWIPPAAAGFAAVDRGTDHDAATVSSLDRKPHFHPAHAACGIEAFTVALDHVGQFQSAAQYLMAGTWKPREPYRIDGVAHLPRMLDMRKHDISTRWNLHVAEVLRKTRCVRHFHRRHKVKPRSALHHSNHVEVEAICAR